MAAYLLVDLDIHDQDGFQEYRSRVPEYIAKYGGEYLVRGGEFEVIEGDWTPNRLVLFRFPDRQAIRNFFADRSPQPICDRFQREPSDSGNPCVRQNPCRKTVRTSDSSQCCRLVCSACRHFRECLDRSVSWSFPRTRFRKHQASASQRAKQAAVKPARHIAQRVDLQTLAGPFEGI